LHRRLGELYLAQKDFAPAAEQLELAWRAAPRDIYLLRPLIEARMKHLLAEQANSAAVGAREDIEPLLVAIKGLDPEAFVSSADAAALHGKYLRARESAADVYAAVLKAGSQIRATSPTYWHRPTWSWTVVTK
jgi:hypothetical protein